MAQPALGAGSLDRAAAGHPVRVEPQGEDFFCVEPVSHVNDGFFEMARGAPEHGMRILQPGETLSGAVRFQPRQLGEEA